MSRLSTRGKEWLTDEPAWKELQNYYASNGSKLNMREMFQNDPDRFNRYR
jgi:hypothetical protein